MAKKGNNSARLPSEKQPIEQSNLAERTAPSEGTGPKFPHPQIMIIDCMLDTEFDLESKGYNVRYERFGIPFKVPRSNKLYPLIISPVTGHEESEILIIDLQGWPAAEFDHISHEEPGHGVKYLWESYARGIIDPRLPAIHQMNDDISRMLEHKGVLVAFASPRKLTKYLIGRMNYRGVEEEGELLLSSWPLSLAESLMCVEQAGEYMNLEIPADSGIGKLLKNHLKDSRYSCTISAEKSDRILVLAKNKFGDAVSVAIALPSGGFIFVFPRIARQAEFISSLVTDVLPEIMPHLFPDSAKNSWVNKTPYELSYETKLKTDIEDIKKQAEAAILEKETAIKVSREKNQFLFDLLTESGDELVEAVKHALRTLGFSEVVDVDQEMREGRLEGTMKREDLWIKGRSPILLVEVKGINGYPSEAESMQVIKYVLPRIRAWNRPDVQGMGIFNHQRHLSPLDREHKNPFTEDTLVNAASSMIGLMTTWDLHRLVRNYLKHGWRHQDVAELFYRTGRIESVPTHYELLGVVDEFWSRAQAFSMKLIEAPQVTLKLKDRIAFELPVEFEEQEVLSLQLDGKNVLEALSGHVPSTKTHLSKDMVKPGVRIFKVKPYA